MVRINKFVLLIKYFDEVPLSYTNYFNIFLHMVIDHVYLYVKQYWFYAFLLLPEFKAQALHVTEM